jgi:PKD repeat protein
MGVAASGGGVPIDSWGDHSMSSTSSAPVRAHRRRLPAFLTAVLTAVVALVPAFVVLGGAPASAATGVVSFVGSATTAGNRASHTVVVPAAVRAGDTLVMFLTTNSTTATVSATLPGWRLLQSVDGDQFRGRAWTRQATAADAGSTVAVTTSALSKSTLSLSGYRSTLGASAVTASASVLRSTSATSHSTPAVTVPTAGSWLVSSWSEKSSSTVTWQAPATTTVRSSAAGTGTGKVSSVVGDSAGPVAAGTAGGRTATTSVAVPRTAEFSVVVSPGASSANQAPVAAFTSSCSALTCAFDATTSSDPEKAALTYAWTFGDGGTATGAKPQHAYASAGARTVTLTVGDGSLTGSRTSTVTVAAAPPVDTLSGLAPMTPRTDMPRIGDGEIWDIDVVGDRVFVAGSFTSIANHTATDTTSYPQAGLASYNLRTGLVDASFRPVFTGAVENAEPSPDGSRLYAAGSFSSVNGVARKGVVRLDPVTGATVAAFTANTDARATELAVSATKVYVGGAFTKVNGVPRRALAAVDGLTGVVDPGFVNDITGGIGINGGLTVQRLKLTHDLTKLLVVHTGRQVAGKDRYGVALIGTATGTLLPWRTTLWQDNLQFVGGIQRAYGADIAPDDTWFAVTSGSGGDRPPINDTIMAFPLDGGDDVKAKWISRSFDSNYSIAIAKDAVYVGGHFSWEESPSAPDPWPGLDDVGYGNGQGLSGYGLGDSVVRREHLGALNPVDGKALEWNPTSNSYEGNKAMTVTSRGLFTGGDATTQGGYNVGRLAWFDPASVAAGNGVETTITDPIEGRVKPAGEQFTINGTASAAAGVQRVQVEVLDRSTKKYLQDDLTTWGAANTILTTLEAPGATSTRWSLALTVPGNHTLQVLARTFATGGASDPTKDTKKFETFGLADQPPTSTIASPAAGVVTTETFTVTGTAKDDLGVTGVTLTLRDSHDRYLQDDGTVATTYNSLKIVPDVVGATSTTWSREVTVPTEDSWLAQSRAVDTSGQSSYATSNRTWVVSATGQAPTVSISAPASMVPPTAAQPFTVTPGEPLTFSGSANDDGKVTALDIALVNTTTHEQLAADGTWGKNSVLNFYRLSPGNLGQSSYNWRWTTPFDLSPGSYTFAVRATDDLGITTPQAQWAQLAFSAVVPGDAPPKALLSTTGTVSGLQSLHLDLAGTATDDIGVTRVDVALKEQASGRYLQPDGSTLSAAYAELPATLAAPGGTSTSWTLPVTLPSQGSWLVTAVARDGVGQQDTSSTGATATYPIFPGDTPPVLTPSLLGPTEGTVFSDGRIFVSGRAEDDQEMARVEVAVQNAQGRYLSAAGTFVSASPSYRATFLTSPGTPGSNFSWTSPVVAAGAYTVTIRGVDQHGLVTTDPPVRHVSVTIPANNPPVASFTTSCTSNVCTFDARGSTDENAPTLTYTWSFGNGTGSGPLPTRTYTAAGTYPVVLTATDEWGATSTSTASVTIGVPAANRAPVPVLNAPSCAGLSCNFSAVGSTDPDTGDTLTYRWDFQDGTASSTAAAPAHTFPAAGTYQVRLTVTDGWGASQTVTREVSVA